MYSYADALKPWLVILMHIPVVIGSLGFLSRQVSIRDGEINPGRINSYDKKLLRKVFVGCLTGLIALIILSPMSRMILGDQLMISFLPG